MAGKDAIDILNQIDSFDGHGDASSLQFFIKNCDAMMKVVKIAEKNTLADLIFATKLKGKAQEVTQFKEFENWEEIKDFLLEQFTDKRPPSHFSTQIMNIRQHFKESAKDYGERIKKLYSKFVETCNLNYSSNEAIVLIDNLKSVLVDTFRKGLTNEKIQIRVIAENTSDLDRAISVAIEIESETSDRFPNRNINLVQQQRNRNFRSDIVQNPNECLFCNRNNHLTSQCRQLRNYEQGIQNKNSSTHHDFNTFNSRIPNISNRQNNFSHSGNNFSNSNHNTRFTRPQYVSNYNHTFNNPNNRMIEQNTSHVNSNNTIPKVSSDTPYRVQTITSQNSNIFNDIPVYSGSSSSEINSANPGNDQEALTVNGHSSAS